MSPALPKGTYSPVSFTLSPCENGKALYQRVAPPTADESARGMLYFTLRATNNSASTLTARELVVSFPGNFMTPIQFPSRDVVIGAGKSAEIGLKGGEEILLAAGGANTLQISVTFDELAQPVVKSWAMQPHAKTYDFFAKPEDDPGYGEFLIMPGNHAGGGGSQHFGYDVKVLGVDNNGNLSQSRNGGTDNSDQFIWGRPVYAMDDGIVVRAVDEHPDNPSPDERAFARKSGSYQGTLPISSVAVGNLSPEANDRTDILRMFSAVISGGTLRVAALAQNFDGSELNYLSGATGPSADDSVSVAGISETRAVTAHRQGSDVRLLMWSIASDGASITQKDTLTVPGLSAAKVVKLASNRVALLGRTNSGNLSLTIHSWEAGDAPGSIEFVHGAIGSASGGGITKFDLLRISSTRLAAALQTANSRLKVIVWDIVPSEGGLDQYATGALTLNRVGEVEGQGTISEVSMGSRDAGILVTAVRDANEQVKLIAWQVQENGALVRRGDASVGEGEDIAISYFKSSAYAVGFRTSEGKLRLEAWETKQDEDTQAITFTKLYQRETYGTTDFYAMTRIPTEQPTLVTAVQTETGVLKMILWQFTDSNLIFILHGNEMVQFVHLMEGSIPDNLLVPGTPVAKGQMVGRMGHSGRSANPHLHFHVTRIHDHLLADVNQLMEDLALGKDNIGEFRPVHFRNVRGMRQSGAVPGWMNNPMSLLNNEGTYFESYVIWPAPGAAENLEVLKKLLGSDEERVHHSSVRR